MASEEYGDCEGWDYTLAPNDFVNRYFTPYMKLSQVKNIENYEYKDLKNRTLVTFTPAGLILKNL